MILAAAALTLSMGAAFADSEGGAEANTLFTEIPGVVAQAPVQNSAVVTAQNGQPVQVYATQSNHGTWLFAPQDGGGANN